MAFEPTPTRRGARAALHPVREAGRVAALTACGVLAAVGALLVPGPSLGVGVLLAVLGGAVVAGLVRVPDLPPLPHPAVAAGRMACVPAAVAGLTALGVPGAAVAVAGLFAATAYVAVWANLPLTTGSPGTTGAPATAEDEGVLRDLLRGLPTDALLEEWRDAQAHDGPAPTRTASGVRLRELLIDEMQRRDPAGTNQWLAVGFDEPPDGYVGGHAG